MNRSFGSAYCRLVGSMRDSHYFGYPAWKSYSFYCSHTHVKHEGIATWRHSKLACPKSSAIELLGVIMRCLFPLLIAGVYGIRPVAAAPKLDAIFRNHPIVLQANFKDDGTPALQARLFGVADNAATF